LSRQTRNIKAAHSVDFVILACTVWHSARVWRTDSRTDRRTNRRTHRRWLRRAKNSAIARKN